MNHWQIAVEDDTVTSCPPVNDSHRTIVKLSRFGGMVKEPEGMNVI